MHPLYLSRKRLRGLGSLLLLLGLVAPPAQAEEAPLPTLVVQNRRVTHTHEFTAAVGVLPLDAFEKGITVSGAYTLHFNELFGWEVAQFFYSFPVETELAADLRAFDLQPTPFERVEYFVTSNLVFKPLYWKGAWLNDGLSYGELLLVMGGGYGWLTRTSRPVADVGAAVRLYASDLVSLRLDLRYVPFFNLDDLQNELWIGLGASL